MFSMNHHDRSLARLSVLDKLPKSDLARRTAACRLHTDGNERCAEI